MGLKASEADLLGAAETPEEKDTSYLGPGASEQRVRDDKSSLLSRELRAQQGSSEITGWCPKCKERAIPNRKGACGFCETPLEGASVEPTPSVHLRLAVSDDSVVEAENTAASGEPLPSGVEVLLQLGPDFQVPLSAATQSLAILAVKGAGKSNAAAVLAEEFYDVGVPWVVIDPKGDWWGIAKSEMNPDGLPIVVMGGIKREGIRHFPLRPSLGSKVAGMIVERNLTCVLDISHMDDEDRSEFLADLANALFELHLHYPSARHIIIEEAHEVIPQSGGLRKTIKAWTRVVTQGRQRGLGITLVSQRSALVHKNVLTQTESLFVLRTTHPVDRSRIKEWTDYHEVSDELVNSLPSLKDGEAWVVAPHWLSGVKRVKFRRRWTYDSGYTPDVVTQVSRVLTADDIRALEQELNGQKVNLGEGAPGAGEFVEGSIKLSPECVVLSMIKQKPRKRGELMEATGLGASRISSLLVGLREEGLIHKVGDKGGAKYADGPDPDHLEQGEPPDPGEDLDLPLPDELATAAKTSVEGLGHTAQEAVARLLEIDRLVEETGLAAALLRARYLALLLRRIEAGDFSPDLLNRFERVAGLAQLE